jgi:hypothetical protein
VRGRIEHYISRGYGVFALPEMPAELGIEPGEQFLETDWLHDEVIRAGVQSHHLVLPASACREDDNRAVDPMCPPMPQQIYPVTIRKTQIENDRPNLV